MNYGTDGYQIQLLAQLSRDRGLYVECNRADLDALEELGLLQWFGVCSSTTPFEQDPRPLLRLDGISGRIDYAWVMRDEIASLALAMTAPLVYAGTHPNVAEKGRAESLHRR
jgi:hypothetical protein